MRRYACLLLIPLLLTACGKKPAPVRRDLSLNKAEQAIRKQDYDTALRHISEAIRIEPDQAYLHLRRGDVLYLSQRYPEALDAYDKAFELNNQSAEAALGAGLTLAMMGQDAEADAHYLIARQLFNQRLSHPPNGERFSEDHIEQVTIHAKLHLALISALRGEKRAALQQIDMIATAHPNWDQADEWRSVVENNALKKLISGQL